MFRSKSLLRFAQTVANTQLRRKSNSYSLFTEIKSRKRCNSVGTQSLDNVRDKINEKSVTRIKSEVSSCINKNKNGSGKMYKSYCTTKNEEKSTKFFTSASASCSKINYNRKHSFGVPLLSLNNPISMHSSEKICRRLTDYNNVAEVLKLNKESIMLSKNIKSVPNIIVTNKKLLSNSKTYGECNRNNNCNKLNEKKKNNNLNYNILSTPNIFSTVKQKVDIRIPVDYSFDRIKNINEPKSKCLKSFTYNYTIAKGSLGMFNHNYKNSNISDYSKKKANTLFKSVKESFKQNELNESHIDKLLKNKNLNSLWIKPKRTKINKNKLSSLILSEIQDKSSIQNKITENKQNMLKCNDFSKIYGRLEKVVQANKSIFDELYFWQNNNITLKESNKFLYKSDKNIFMNYQTRSLKTSVIGFNCAKSSIKALKSHKSIEKENNGNQTCNIAKQKNYSLPSSKNNYLTNNLSDDAKCGFNYTKKNQKKNVLNSIYKKNSKSIYDGFTKVLMDKVHLCIKSLKNRDHKQNTIYGNKSNYFIPSITFINEDENWFGYYQSNDEKKSIRNLNERKSLSNDFKKDYMLNKSLLEMTGSKKINNCEDSLEKSKLSKSKINKLKLNKLGDKKDQKFNKVELRKPTVVRVQVKGYELPKVHPSLNIASNIHDYDFNKKAVDNKSVIPNVMIRTDSVKTMHSIASYSKRKTHATEYVKNKHHKTHNTLSCLSNDNKIENHENKNQIQEFNNERKTINTEQTELSTKKAIEKIIKNKIDTAVAWEHDKIYKKDKNIPFNFKGELIIKQHASCDDKANLNSIQYINHKTIRKTQPVKNNLIKSNSAIPWIHNKDDDKSDGINLKSNINNFTDNDNVIPWVRNSTDYVINQNLKSTNNIVQNSQIENVITQIDKVKDMELLYQNIVCDNYKLMDDKLLLSDNQNEYVSVNEPSSFEDIKQRELNRKCKIERANANQCNVEKQITNISNEENTNSSLLLIKRSGTEYENLNSLNSVKENKFEKCEPQNIDVLSKNNKILLRSEKNELEIMLKDNSLLSKETKILLDENFLCKSDDQVVEEINISGEKTLFLPFIPPQESVNKHTITHYYQNKISSSFIQFKENQDYNTAEELTELSKFKSWNENADLQTSGEQLLNSNKIKEKHESVINNEVIKNTEGLNSVLVNEVPLHCSDLLVNINKSPCQENDEVESLQKLPTNQLLNKEETDDNKQSENNDNRNNKKELQPLPDDNYKGFNEVLNKTHKQMKQMYEYEKKDDYERCNHNRNEQLDRKKNNINKKEPKFSDYDNSSMDTKTHAERMAELYEYEAIILGIYDHSHPANDYGNNIINSSTVNFNTLQNSFKPKIVPSSYERKNNRLQRKNKKKHLSIRDLSNQIEETVKKQTKFEDNNHNNIKFNYKEHKTEWVESKDLVTSYLHLFQGNEVMKCSIPSSLSESGQLTKSQDGKKKTSVKVNNSEIINITVEVPLSKQTKTDNMLEQCASVDAQNHIHSSTLNKKVEMSAQQIKNMKYSGLDSEDNLVFGNHKLGTDTENSKNYILRSENNNRYIVINKADKKLENTTKENESLEDEKAVLRNVNEETKSEIDKENFQQSSTKLLSESSGHISNRTITKPKSFLEESEMLESKEAIDTKIQSDELMILQNILSNDSELLGNDSFTVCFPKKRLSAELLKFSNKESFKLLNNKNTTHTVVKTVLNAIAYTVQKNQKTCKLTDKDVINNKRLCNDLSFSLENNSTDNTLDNEIKTNNESQSDNVKEDHIMIINEVKFPMINEEKSALLYPKETEITLNRKKKCVYKHIPSVSKILNETLPHAMKDALDKWNCSNKTDLSTPQETEEYYKEQLLNDMEFHDCIRRHFLKTPLNLLTEQDNPRLKGSLKSLKHIFPRISNVRGLESPVIHPELPYYGIVDCIACYDGNPVLIEWKQSDQPKSLLDLTYDAPLQLSAYIGAINHDQNYNLPINSGLIIVAHTDGSPADVFHLPNHECKKYWKKWLERIEKYIDSKITS